jgi:hypothetical protein
MSERYHKFAKGNVVKLVTPNDQALHGVPVGCIGHVIASAPREDGAHVLVKWIGHGGPRACHQNAVKMYVR